MLSQFKLLLSFVSMGMSILILAACGGGGGGGNSDSNSQETISLSYTGKINDTGIALCSDEQNESVRCGATNGYSGQDGQSGGDITRANPNDGVKGFSFKKIHADGHIMDRNSEFSTSPWSCVHDVVTGLLWEVKTNDKGLRSGQWLYLWQDAQKEERYISHLLTTSETCFSKNECATDLYIKQLNDSQLCGRSDWRLPTRGELMSIIDYGTTEPGPMADKNYFPYVSPISYWSASTAGFNDYYVVSFYTGKTNKKNRDNFHSVRLVSGGRE